MSARLEEELGLRVPGDLAAFFREADPSAIAAGGAIAEPLSVEEILAVELPALPIDFVPLAGDGSGDLLCARIGPQGDVVELVLWAHDDDGNGLPFGRTFAEALLLSAARLEDGDAAARARTVEWAARHVDAALATAVRGAAHDAAALREVLLAHGVGVESLGEPGTNIVRGARYEIHDARFQRYYKLTEILAGSALWYDLSSLPAPVRAVLDKDYGGVSEPDWAAMERAASRVIARRDDIGWAFILRADLAGRAGDADGARRAVRAAAGCLQRTFHLHGAELLRGVRPLLDTSDPLVAALLDDDAAPAVAAHWEKQAEAAEAAGDPARAWDGWYRHVHHRRQYAVRDAQLLDRYARAAERGGFSGWAKLAARRRSSRA